MYNPISKKAKITICVVTVSLLATAGIFLAYYTTHSAATLPDFQTVLPENKSINQLHGWQRVSPPQDDPVFAYSDTINNVAITVSQQRLPTAFSSDIDSHVADLAKKFNATDKIDASGTTVYVGTSVKGPQSAILTKNNLLILIKSAAKIAPADWAAYVSALK